MSPRRFRSVSRRCLTSRASAVTAACERLEPRALLSLTPAGVEFRLNTFTTNSQSNPAVAMDGDGDFIVAWQSAGQDGSGSAIIAQRINFNGLAFPLTEFRVNTFTGGNQTNPAIAKDADGDGVIVWQSTGQDGSGDGIYAQRYANFGVVQGNELRINQTTAGDQIFPAVASDAAGNFVVVWNSIIDGASGWDVVGRRYNFNGIPQGDEFRINAFTTNNQLFPVIAMDADGDFVVAWNSYGQDGDANGIYAQRFDAAGQPQGDEFRANTFTAGDQDFPSVGMSFGGAFVIAWESAGQDGSGDGVYAQRYNAAGAAQGAEFRVNVTTGSHQGNPTLAMDADGDFVVAWASSTTGNNDVFARQYNAAGVAQTSEFRVNTYTTANQSFPVVAIEHEGDPVFAWESDGQDGSTHGIYAQRYDAGADVAGPVVSAVEMAFHRFTPGVRLAQNSSFLTLRFSEDLSTAGGTSGPNSATNAANYAVTRNGQPFVAGLGAQYSNSAGVYRVTLGFQLNTLPDGDYVLTVRDGLRDTNGVALDGNLDGAPGGDFTAAFTIASPVRLGREFRVNTVTVGDQWAPAVASDAAGNFVVAWTSADGGGGQADLGVFAQRYDSSGVRIGGEFRVNAHTTNMQREPAIAMDADGDFVVAWQSFLQDGFAYGIYAQRFNASGVPQGDEFRVNTATIGQQIVPTVGMSPSGDFVIAWESNQDGSIGSIYAQRYSASGVPLGSEFRVNTFTTGSQYQASVAMNLHGDFVIAWGGGASPAAEDVFIQRYNSSGVPLGGETRVNVFTTGTQHLPTVAMNHAGSFVVAWTSVDQDGSGSGIYLREYNSAGVPNGGERLPNTFTTGNQFYPTLAMDADGDFVVTWTSAAQDGSEFGVYGTRFNGAFSSQTFEFRINRFTTGTQWFPAVAMDADGDFVVVWESFDQDGSGNGVFAQRYAFAPPAVEEAQFHFLTAPHRLSFTFNQDVRPSLNTNDLLLENLTTGQTISSALFNAAFDGDTNTGTFSFQGVTNGLFGVLPDGRYRATIFSAGVSNPNFTPMAQDFSFEFIFLNGDANRDGRVNLDDFNILAANFGQSPRDFTQGDFNYDGVVNLPDFNILAARFGGVLAGASSIIGQTRERDGDESDARSDLLA